VTLFAHPTYSIVENLSPRPGNPFDSHVVARHPLGRSAGSREWRVSRATRWTLRPVGRAVATELLIRTRA
jgi:hypothetical protein